MGKWRKKPVEVEAVKWTGENIVEMEQFATTKVQYTIDNRLLVETKEGVMRADIGDFIIKGVKGEYYPCKPDIFEMTYDKVIEK
jgi:hypothetical protein